MLTIYGRASSGNVQKVLWICAEMGVAYRRIDMGLAFGGNDRPEYLAMNPNGRVPTIDDDGFILWESNSIVRYLTAKQDTGGLYPADPHVRADADRWMDWQLTTLGPAFQPMFMGMIRTPEAERDSAAIEKSRAETARCFGVMDKQLAGRKYLVADTLTMGDIPFAGFVCRWHEMDIERPSLPNLYAWYQRLCEREAYRDHIMTGIS